MIEIAFDLYRGFQCASSECPYTCCAGWSVALDEETDRFYQSCAGELGEYINRNIQRENGTAVMILRENGRCPMLDENNLCRIQLAYGPDRLSTVCRLFPRLAVLDDGLKMNYLQLSCPEAARMVLTHRESMRILRHEAPDPPGRAAGEAELCALRREAFFAALRIIQDRECDIVQRQRLFLLMSQAVQNAIREQDYNQADKLLALFRTPEEYRRILRDDNIRTEASDKIHFLNSLRGSCLSGEGASSVEYHTIYTRAMQYILNQDANLIGFVAYLKKAREERQQNELENLLSALLPGHYLSSFAGHDLYIQAAYVLFLAQLYRAISAMLYAGGSEQEREISKPLLVSYIYRYFCHTTDEENNVRIVEALRDKRLTDMDYLFRLVG